MNIFKSTASLSRTVSRSRFQSFNLPSVYIRQASNMQHNVPKLKDQSLLKLNVAYVNGEWVGAKSGKTFEVTGTDCSQITGHVLISCSSRPLIRQIDRCRRSRLPLLQNQDRPWTLKVVKKMVRFDGMLQTTRVKGKMLTQLADRE